MGGNKLDVSAASVGMFGAATGPEEIEALTPSILDGWMGMGPRVREFETAFATRLGLDFAMTDSGSNALHLAVRALELPPGSDVVLPVVHLGRVRERGRPRRPPTRFRGRRAGHRERRRRDDLSRADRPHPRRDGRSLRRDGGGHRRGARARPPGDRGRRPRR